MALIGEAFNSRDQQIGWENSRATLRYLIEGTEDEIAVRTIVEAVMPAFYAPTSDDPTLIIQNYELAPIGGGIWTAACNYGQKTPKKPGDSTYTFDTAGGTQKIEQSLNTTAFAPAGATAPDTFGLIGNTGENVEGVEITVPVFNWTEIQYIAIAGVTTAYKNALYALTGLVNNATWRGFAAGSVLFLGASGSQRGQDDWEITFKFAASPNRTGLSVGAITGIAKQGWQYLWVRYQDTVDAVANVMTKKPVAAYVETVYYTGDFTTLGIGS